jgi:hypothetical protein
VSFIIPGDSGGGGGTPGGADTNVQFNDGGAFGGQSSFSFNKVTSELSAGSLIGSLQQDFVIVGVARTDAGPGYRLRLLGGSALSGETGGGVSLLGGAGVSGAGGDAEVRGGSSDTNLGGTLVLSGGSTDNAGGGDLRLFGGYAQLGSAGNVDIVGGFSDAGPTAHGDVRIIDPENGEVVIRVGTLNSGLPGLGFFGSSVNALETVSGSRGGNAALASLLSALANYGLIIDSSS